MKSVTDIQWAVICTLRQQPDYQFAGHELNLARKMVDLGLLSQCTNDQRRFVVTDLGLELYNKPTAEEIDWWEKIVFDFYGINAYNCIHQRNTVRRYHHDEHL